MDGLSVECFDCLPHGETYVDMPYTLPDIVRAWPRPDLCGITTNDLIPSIDFESPDSFREEAGGDKVEEARRDDEEVLERRNIATSV